MMMFQLNTIIEPRNSHDDKISTNNSFSETTSISPIKIRKIVDPKKSRNRVLEQRNTSNDFKFSLMQQYNSINVGLNKSQNSNSILDGSYQSVGDDNTFTPKLNVVKSTGQLKSKFY
mmetsp:Transcript_19724/g.22051  ORF Transcript_19724/g.22051 Transcript_19724/m.22051 type:complete len:117 (-) Transcript_19724:24-374(-)